MTHLEFVNKLDEIGISIRSTSVEGRTKRYELIRPLSGKSEYIIKDGFDLRWQDGNPFGNDPLKSLIKMAIDMDSWQHSWHNEIIQENYEKFQVIIQEKIIQRAKQIDLLLDVYFQLQHELSENQPEP